MWLIQATELYLAKLGSREWGMGGEVGVCQWMYLKARTLPLG